MQAHQCAADNDGCGACVKRTTNRHHLISTMCVCVRRHRRGKPLTFLSSLQERHKTRLLNWCSIKLAFANAVDFLCALRLLSEWTTFIHQQNTHTFCFCASVLLCGMTVPSLFHSSLCLVTLRSDPFLNALSLAEP